MSREINEIAFNIANDIDDFSDSMYIKYGHHYLQIKAFMELVPTYIRNNPQVCEEMKNE